MMTAAGATALEASAGASTAMIAAASAVTTTVAAAIVASTAIASTTAIWALEARARIAPDAGGIARSEFFARRAGDAR